MEKAQHELDFFDSLNPEHNGVRDFHLPRPPIGRSPEKSVDIAEN